MNKEKALKNKNRVLRKKRTRAQIIGNSQLPRLSVFRSLKHIYAQVIDDKKGITICAASDKEIKAKKDQKPVDIAALVGEAVAKKALDKKIEKVIFDRGEYKYHGAINALAESARKVGLKF